MVAVTTWVPVRLLLVEDHQDTAELLATLLEARGHQVTIAATVKEALAITAHKRFDLVVSDLGLPDASGYDLMQQLRSTTPIKGIAMSGWGGDEDVTRSRDAGFAEHLTKPVKLQHLEQAIQRVAAS